MRSFLKMSGISLLALLSQSAWAVQGNLQSSSGFVASTVGGATVAQFTNEFDAVIDNPALMQLTKTSPGTHKFSLGIEYASYPNSFAIDAGGVKNSYVKGKLDTAWIPFLAYFYNINDRFKFGTGLYAIGGTGYDYSKSVYVLKGEYAAASVPLAFSYKVSDAVNIGASLNIVATTLKSNNNAVKDTKANALTLAPSLGATLALPSSLLLGADVVMGTTAKYKNFYAVSATQTNDMEIGTPLQFAVGLGQNKDSYSVGFKYRFVNWKNTENYKQLGWKDQHTFSLGGQVKCDRFIGRAGIYYVTSVYDETKNVNGDQTINFQGATLSKYARDYANALMYGIPLWQYSLGAGYKLSQKSILDTGIVYEPEDSIKFSGTSVLTGGAYEIRKKNSNLQIFIAYSHEV